MCLNIIKLIYVINIINFIAALNEVKVIVRVIDVNDNLPKFTVNGRPIVAAIPTSTNYGYHIVKLEVKIIRFFFS